MAKKTVFLGLILLLCGGLFLFNTSVQADENDEAEMKMCVNILYLLYSPANANVSNFPGSCNNGVCQYVGSRIGHFSGWVTKSGCDPDTWHLNINECGTSDLDEVNLKNCGGCG